jgi:hypothetical protein
MPTSCAKDAVQKLQRVPGMWSFRFGGADGYHNQCVLCVGPSEPAVDHPARSVGPRAFHHPSGPPPHGHRTPRRHDAPNVTTMDDGPIPDGSWLAREERNTRNIWTV